MIIGRMEKNVNGRDFIKHIIKSALALENPLIEEFLSMFVRKERDATYYIAIKEAARVQRLSFEKEGKKEEADSMFLIEMRAIRELRRLKSRKFLLFEYFLELVLGDWIALYGTKGRRILLWSILVITWFAFAYALTLLNPLLGIVFISVFVAIWLVLWYSYTFKKRWKTWQYITLVFTLSLGFFMIFDLGEAFMESYNILKFPAIVTGNDQSLIPTGTPITLRVKLAIFLNALYYSLVTFTTLGYGDMHPTGWLKALSALEALTGAVFMALIVAVIARKWMR